MKRFRDYQPSAAMTEAIRALGEVRARLARIREKEDTRQPAARSTLGEHAKPGGGRDRQGKRGCGELE